MHSSKYKYSIHNFIICLQSVKLNYQKKISNSDQPLTPINAILRISTIPLKEKHRINYIIESLSSSTHIKHRILAYKYLQQFIYKYEKYNQLTLKSKTKKIYNALYTIALTHIYIVYKLLNSKKPLFTYYYLIKSNTKQ